MELDSVTPIQRVVHLLKDMSQQLEKEAKNDQELYEELQCWCKTNDKEKTQAVKDAEAKIAELEAEIESRAGRQGELLTTVAQLRKEIDANIASLAKARKVREEEQKDFTESQKDLIQSIASLKQAVVVLSKQNTSLLEMPPELKVSIKAILHNAGQLHRAFSVAKGGLDDDVPVKNAAFLQTGAMAEFMDALQDPTTSQIMDTNMANRILATALTQESAKQPAGYKSYNNRSGQIFGIIQSMLEEFQNKATEAEKAETQAQIEFLQLENAKTREIASAEKQHEDKKAEAGDNGKKLADAKEELTNIREIYSSDKAFLRNLEVQCQNIDHQFAQRQKTRSDEIAGISEALAMLVDDDNREQLQKTTFLQISESQEHADLRARVIHVLETPDIGTADMEAIWKGRNAPTKKLSALVAKSSLDSFKKVKAAMDQMIADLKTQQEEENKHKDFCNAEFTSNKVSTRDTTYKKEDLNTKIENLDNQITVANEEIKKATSEIARLEVEIKKASEDREKENKEFQTEVNDQRATQQILQKVLARLNVFYGKSKKASVPKTSALQANIIFTQTKQQPPKSFGTYKENRGGSPVIALINKIVADSKAAEAEAVSDEKSSQLGYESFVNDSNQNIANLNRLINQKSDAIASDKEDKDQAKSDFDFSVRELEKLAAYKADLHQSCDFLLKNFELRQNARTQELEAIAQAKSILSGALPQQ